MENTVGCKKKQNEHGEHFKQTHQCPQSTFYRASSRKLTADTWVFKLTPWVLSSHSCSCSALFPYHYAVQYQGKLHCKQISVKCTAPSPGSYGCQVKCRKLPSGSLVNYLLQGTIYKTSTVKFTALYLAPYSCQVKCRKFYGYILQCAQVLEHKGLPITASTHTYELDESRLKTLQRRGRTHQLLAS